MKRQMIGVLAMGLVLAAGQAAFAQEDKAAYDSATRVTSWLLSFLVSWGGPITAVLVALYGLYHGMKRGEWGTALTCFGFAIALVFVLQIVLKAFGLDMTSIARP
jgi:uncharacterized membrane protein YidH (DUF202 family)